VYLGCAAGTDGLHARQGQMADVDGPLFVDFKKNESFKVFELSFPNLFLRYLMSMVGFHNWFEW
jgi:hypothetical protein